MLRRFHSIFVAARRFSTSPSSSISSEGPILPLYRRLSALGVRPGEEGSVKLTMNKWLREGNHVSAKQVVSFVKQLRKYGKFRHALELMEWMDMKGMNMSYGNHALRMLLISKVNGVKSAEKYFIDLPEPAMNGLTYGALMSIYCTEKMTDKAISLYEKIRDFGYDDSLVYNNLINLFVKGGKQDMVPPLLEKMKAKKVCMDSFIYNTLITFYASLGDIESVDRTVQQMEADNPSCQRWPAYSNLASVYISIGQVEKAKSSLAKLKKHMHNKDRAAHHHLISLHARIGDLAEVKQVWISLNAAMKPTNMSYLVVLQALDRLDDFDEQKQCFYEWDSKYETYDVRLANVMIGAYLRRGMVAEAKSLLERIIAKGREPDWRTFTLFMDHYLRNQDFESALECFETGVKKLRVWRLEKSAVDSILQHFKEKKDFVRAEAFCQRVKELDRLPQHLPSTDVVLESMDEHSQIFGEEDTELILG